MDKINVTASFPNLARLKSSVVRLENDMVKLAQMRDFNSVSNYEKMIRSELQAIMVEAGRVGKDVHSIVSNRQDNIRKQEVSNALSYANDILRNINQSKEAYGRGSIRGNNQPSVNQPSEQASVGEARQDDSGREGTGGDSSSDGKSSKAERKSKKQPDSGAGKKSRGAGKRTDEKRNGGDTKVEESKDEPTQEK